MKGFATMWSRNARAMAVVIALVLVSVAPNVYGQVATGTVQGTVKDQSGAVVSGATVSMTNLGTALARSQSTDSNGAFSFLALPIGKYSLVIEAKGFAKYSESIQVTVGLRLDRQISLGVGTAAVTLEVVGGAAATVNTIDPELSSVVTSTELTSLPLVVRNPYALVATAANVQMDGEAGGVGDMRGTGFAMNGQRSASTSILMDGAENVNMFGATVGQPIPLDSMAEFRVVTNGMSAEYGRASGGAVNVATKSGTNNFHGSAYEFNRVSALASNTYDNAANGIKKARFTRNQFGYSIGGPIVKDKVFFFNNTEWIRVRSNAAQVAQIADPAFIAAANANTQNFFTTYGHLRPDLRQIGTVTVSDIFNKDGVTPGPALTAYGGPNCGGTADPTYANCPGKVFDTVTYNTAADAGAQNPQNTLLEVARVDWNINDRTQVFARYSLQNRNDFAGVLNTSAYAGYETGQSFKDNAGMVSLSHAFTPRLLSNTRLVITRLNDQNPLSSAPVGPTLYMNNGVAKRSGGHNIGFPGYNEYTPGGAIPFGGPQNLFQVYQDLSLVRGKHTFRVGGQFIRTQDNRTFGAYKEAVEALSTASVTRSYENFLAGNLASFQAAVYPQGKLPCKYDPVTGAEIKIPDCQVTLPVAPPQFSRSNLYNDSAVYGQDDWKVTQRLTVNLGLRWEYYGIQHNRKSALDSNFYYGSGTDPWDRIRNGSVQIAPQSSVGGLWAPQKKNFGPRVGFAYDVFGDGKTSLRGGYGIAYERNFNNVTFNTIQNPPNYAVLSILPADVGGPIPITTDNAGPLAGSTGSKYLPRTSLRHVDQNIKTAYTEQWDLNLEREVIPKVVATLGYAGARGLHQYSISNINENGFAQVYLGDTSPNRRLDTQFSNINNRGSRGDSYYHAMVGQLRGNWKNAQFNVNYTWSHTIDTLSSTFSDEVANNGLGYLDPFITNLDRGNADFDARHRVSMSAVIPLPFFDHSSNKALKGAAGGWQLAPIFTYHTGYPFTVFDCTYAASPYNCPRAFILSGDKAPKTGSAGHDTGGNLFNYLAVPASIADIANTNANSNVPKPGANQYTGPAVITGTNVPFPMWDTWTDLQGADHPITTASNLPTCTGVHGQGCAFPSNMLPRNSFTGPGNWTLDFGIYKDFAVTERFKMQLRGEFFDLTNHKNFYVVGFGQGGADVSGLPTNASGLPIVQAKKGGFANPFDDHRNVQIALRLTF